MCCGLEIVQVWCENYIFHLGHIRFMDSVDIVSYLVVKGHF